MKMQKYNIEIELVQDQLGTVPKDREVYVKYVANNIPKEKAEEEALGIPEAETPEDKGPGWTIFMSDEKGIYILNHIIVGFLRDAGNSLKEQLGIKQVKSKMESCVFVTPRKIRFERDGQIIQEPDAIFERPLRGMTMQGPRVTLVKSDVVKVGAHLKFQITLLDHKEITADVLREVLSFGQFRGLGQFRNGGYGQFEVISFEEAH